MSIATSPFVGRERELARLLSGLEHARAGTGSVLTLIGEPGIGKTRTAQEFAAAAKVAGAQVLWGACYEGEWAPPFGPWASATAELAASLEQAALAERLGPSAPALAEVVQAVRELLPELPAPPPLPAEEARYRTYEAFARLLLADADRTLVLVLDDLHWADGASLELLRYVARSIWRSKLLLVATYRDVEVDLSHPLTLCLAEVERELPLERLQLGSLDDGETSELVKELYGGPPPAGLADEVLRETEGNPFFIGEVVRHLRDRPGEPARVPESIRQAVANRLARLSPATGRALALAAAFTGPFEFSVLQVLTDLSEDALLECLDEALRARMLVAAGTDERYEFAHALVRHTLYDELSPSRRSRVHRRIAQALERVYAGRERECARELAEQYHRSASLPGAAHGLPHALAAAAEATARHAPEDAARLLRIARDLSAEAAPRVRADILCRLALCEAEALLIDDARRTIEQALDLLETSGASPDALADFACRAAWALKDAGARDELFVPLVERGLAANGDRRDLAWARLKLALTPFERRTSGELRFAHWLGFDPVAVAVTRAHGDEQDYARTVEPNDRRSWRETQELLELVRGWTHPGAKSHALSVVARSFIYWSGALREAAEVALELLAVAERHGSLPGQAFALAMHAELEMALGEFASAAETRRRAAELVVRLGPAHRLHQVVRNASELELIYIGGDWRPIAEAYTHAVTDPTSHWDLVALSKAGVATRAWGQLGDRANVERLLASFAPAMLARTPADMAQSGMVSNPADAIWTLGLQRWARRYRRLALDLIEAGIGDNSGHSHELTVARMAALAGDLDEASEYFGRARVTLDASGQRPLRAIVDHDEALVRRRGGRPGAAALLAAAREQFERLGMTCWVERSAQLGARRSAGLTSRELEVLRLLAEGLTNREIAARLLLSVRTVERHVANAYAKIGTHRRAEAAGYAIRHDL